MRARLSQSIVSIGSITALFAALIFAFPSAGNAVTSSRGVHVSITDNKNEVHRQSTLVYVVTLSNDSPVDQVVDVDLRATSQLDFVSASDDGLIGRSRLHWESIPVPAYGRRTLTTSARVNSEVDKDEVVRVQAIVDRELSQDSTTVVQDFAPINNFRIRVSDNRAYAEPGEQLIYRISVTNLDDVPTRADVSVFLSHLTEFLYGTVGYARDRDSVVWRSVPFNAGEERIYTLGLELNKFTTEGFVVRTNVRVGIARELDQTVVKAGLPYNAIAATIRTNRMASRPGQLITYTVNVHNRSTKIASQVYVNAGVPTYTEFVEASNGGTWDGTNVRWHFLQIAPYDHREVIFTIRVRSDAPMGTELLASASVNGTKGEHVSTRVADTTPWESTDAQWDAIAMPQTGADMASITFTMLGAILAGATTLAQRRKVLPV